jgi:hypothetical protein
MPSAVTNLIMVSVIMVSVVQPRVVAPSKTALALFSGLVKGDGISRSWANSYNFFTNVNGR